MYSELTFAGGTLNRAAHLRAGASVHRADPRARVIAMWKLKPLVGEAGLTLLPSDHPVLRDAATIVFLGLDAHGAPLFGADVSAWIPPDMPDFLDGFLDASAQVHPDAPEGSAFRELRAVMAGLDAFEAECAATARAILGWHVSHRFCALCGHESVAAMGGWQRDCPACDGHHFPRTDPVVIMLITSGNDVLIGRSPGWPDGMYSLLAGFVEPGETVEAAVRREVAEETGVPVGDVRYLMAQPWPFPSSLMFGCAGEATAREITIDPAEIEEARWVSREDMVEIFAGRHREILPPRQGAVAHFILRNWLADKV